MPKPNRREEEIIETAGAIFRQKGYHATTLEEIANAVGIRKAGLYHYVRTKDDLLMLILKRGMQLITEELGTIYASEVGPAERLRLAIVNHVVAMDSRRNLMGIVAQEHRAVPAQHREAYMTLRDSYERLFRKLIAEGIACGSFRPCDPVLVTRAILGMCNWLAIWYLPGGRFSPSEVANEYATLILKGVESGHVQDNGHAIESSLAASGSEDSDAGKVLQP